MNRSVVCIALGSLFGAPPASLAQVAGIPAQTRFLVYSKAAIALDGGVVGAHDSGTGVVLGTAASALVFGRVVVRASGSIVLPMQAPSFGSYGMSADVFQWIHVGVGRWDSAGTSRLHVPLGLTVPFGWCVRSDRAWLLWVGGRRDFERVAPAFQRAYSDDAWAYSVGFAIEARRGVGVQIAFDQTTRGGRDWSISGGVHLGLKALPRGTRTKLFSGTSTFSDTHPCWSLPGELAGH
jgi:hypothetical protein